MGGEPSGQPPTKNIALFERYYIRLEVVFESYTEGDVVTVVFVLFVKT